ncbi:MAG: hypothetical protein II975_00770 [Bacteroidales bacterium]|nr:hypothetical protein [Bacteroidales bacterium]
MKTIKYIGFVALAAMVMVGCGSSKKAVQESRIETGTSLEGAQVAVETVKYQGIEMADGLSEDGSSIVKVAYKWYAGIGKADDKQTAVEMSELEARATISRIIENAVQAEAERGSLVNNGETQKALTSHWQQVSKSIQNACEPFGNAKIEYNPATKMYTVTSKVGIRGDKFQQMLNNAGNYKPQNLSGQALDDFIKVNKSIMNAAKGN